MRVLYVGPYRDGTGWSHAAISYILALDTVGVEVVCRPVKLNEIAGEVPYRITELEQRRFDRYDAVIQNVLPHQMDYNGRLGKNIGLYYTETTNFIRSGWADRINCMDFACVPNRFGIKASRQSQVSIPLHHWPIPCETQKYCSSYDELSIREKLGDNFIFYFIGEFNRRKNISALLKAFHTEFDVNEPVSLLIKTSPKGGLGPHAEYDTQQRVIKFCQFIKSGMKLYDSIDKYKPEIVIAGRYSDDEMMRLHFSCDCLIAPSYGEAWHIPAFDAMALGKTPIVTGWNGFVEFMNNSVGWVVPYHMEPVFGTQEDTFTNLQVGIEEWAQINIASLRSAMREAFENRKLREQKSWAGIERAYDFSYARIGKIMKETLKNESGMAVSDRRI